ncbi:MAG: DUF4268 domain-containing protein [Chitinophagaceae bacterium]
MYNRQEASLLRKKFWTGFGQYMRPVTGANGDTINWLNYKTGIRHIYFRMDADSSHAAIAIELRHPDRELQRGNFEKLLQLKVILKQSIGEDWNWQLLAEDEDGHFVSKVSKEFREVNIFREEDWPAIISFLKPRIIALDGFWQLVKDGFEQ